MKVQWVILLMLNMTLLPSAMADLGPAAGTLQCEETGTRDAGFAVRAQVVSASETPVAQAALFEMTLAGPREIHDLGCFSVDRDIEAVGTDGFQVAFACALPATWDTGYGVVLREHVTDGEWRASVYEFHLSGLYFHTDLVCFQPMESGGF